MTTTDGETRYRCAGCGNLTRFDVLMQQRARRFVHYTLAGDPEIEEEEILDERIERVTCRWCGSADQIELVPRVQAE